MESERRPRWDIVTSVVVVNYCEVHLCTIVFSSIYDIHLNDARLKSTFVL